jgi:hypothetical protein
MADPTHLDRFEALLLLQEAAVRLAFRRFVAAVGYKGPIFDAIMEALEARDTAGALKIVDSYVANFGNVLPSIAQTVGAATAIELAELVPQLALAISFDPTHVRAAELIRAHRLEFVTNFSAQQRRATLQALARGQREGMGNIETARLFRESIGLTAPQEAAIGRYREDLQNLERRALDNATRDRRFDQTVERAIESGRPLTERQIDMMVTRRRGQMLALRAETIARTEGGRATSQAREEALDQMIAQTGIAIERIERIWNPTRDKRTRDWHASMAGQRRGRNEPFVDGLGNRIRYPHDPAAAAETVINCRCGLTFSVLPAA